MFHEATPQIDSADVPGKNASHNTFGRCTPWPEAILYRVQPFSKQHPQAHAVL
jgi:hypothetical protein